MTADVEGPLWCAPGLVERAGRYPLAVEAPVMAGVDVLAPGVSTLTAYARYYSLYWAIAAHADAHGLDREACRRLVRRAAVGLAMISQAHDDLTTGHGRSGMSVNRTHPGRERSAVGGRRRRQVVFAVCAGVMVTARRSCVTLGSQRWAAASPGRHCGVIDALSSERSAHASTW